MRSGLAVQYDIDFLSQTFLHGEGCVKKFNDKSSPLWTKPRKYREYVILERS